MICTLFVAFKTSESNISIYKADKSIIKKVDKANPKLEEKAALSSSNSGH